MFHPTSRLSQFPDPWKPKLKQRADDLISGNLEWFSKHRHNVGNPPDWFRNPFNGLSLSTEGLHWTKIGDFQLNVGDIKVIWEPSRFDWLIDLSRAYRVFGDERYLKTLNVWLIDWLVKNPENIGVNWKCGQECSIRVMKLITTLHLLDQFDSPTPAVIEVLRAHINRINGNINYAQVQCNNHWTSEAAALFIGAAYLYKCTNDNKYARLSQRGYSLFEKAILTLTGANGTFSQESVTYHRVVADTVSWVLWGRGLLKLTDFDNAVYSRFRAILEWQFSLTISENGNMPNIGANDGAMFENLHCNDYRDFRPSTQLLNWALNRTRVYDKALLLDEPVFWRYGEVPSEATSILPKPVSRVFDGSFLLMEAERVKVVVKLPNARWRQKNNVFHIDFWLDGIDVLRGAGSYSYNSQLSEEFKSIRSSNSIQFDNAEPMPKLSRFLNGEWIKTIDSDLQEDADGSIKWSGSYKDYKGNWHKRSISLESNRLLIVDEIKSTKKALAYWHLPYATLIDEKVKFNFKSLLSG